MQRGKRKYSLSDLSTRFDLELRGDGNCQVDGVATLISAQPNQITFLANPAYRKELPSTRASAVILQESDVGDCPTNCLLSPDPYLSYARMAALFDSRPMANAGIHKSAVVDDSARIGEGVSIGPHVVVGMDCEIGDNCVIEAGTVLDSACRIGANCQLHSNVTLGYGVALGQRVIIHPGAVIGADGFGIALAADHWEKVPQLGSVVIGNDCEIGCNTTIDRGAIGDTVLEDDVRVDNLCQIAHNVHIGAHTAMAAMSGIAGSTTIGKYCLLAGGAGVSGHLEIADKTTIAAYSSVMRSITEPGTTWSSQFPAQPVRDWQRNLTRFRKLDELTNRIRKLKNKN